MITAREAHDMFRDKLPDIIANEERRIDGLIRTAVINGCHCVGVSVPTGASAALRATLEAGGYKVTLPGFIFPDAASVSITVSW